MENIEKKQSGSKIAKNLNEISCYIDSVDSTVSALEKDLSIYLKIIKKINIQSSQQKPNTVSVPLLEKCAIACQLSYNREKSNKNDWLKEIIENKIFKSVQPFNLTNKVIQGYFGIDFADNVFIIFRGSDSFNDWRANLTAIFEPLNTDQPKKKSKSRSKFGFNFNIDFQKIKPYTALNNKILIHKGFIDIFKKEFKNSLEDQDFLSSHIANHPQKKIIVSGHSLGGALAYLCAEDIAYNSKNQNKNNEIDLCCITFGAPRIGNKHFKNYYNKKVRNTFRVSYGNDIVTKIPLVFFNYRHIGKHYDLGPSKIMKILHFLSVFKDHEIENYITALK